MGDYPNVPSAPVRLGPRPSDAIRSVVERHHHVMGPLLVVLAAVVIALAIAGYWRRAAVSNATIELLIWVLLAQRRWEAARHDAARFVRHPKWPRA